MSALSLHLLPETAAVQSNGHLSIGGCDVVELAAEFGTPLFVYDEEHLRRRCREAVAAFGPGVNYASKAFLCKAMAQLAAEEQCNIDVSTAGEYHVARAAGVPADRLVLHGNNKSDAELRRALNEGVGRVIVDSFDEFDRIDALVTEGCPTPKVLIRVTPGVEAHTHEFIRTGQDDSKFGFGLASGEAQRAIDRARSGSVQLMGVHCHIGSQIFEERFFRDAIEVLVPFLSANNIEEFSVGGGLGVAYTNDESSASITEWGQVVHEACRAAGITAKITAEPGRAIVAQAAVTLYTVGTMKEIPGIRTYVSVDGGMSDNPRPVLYQSKYEAFLPRAVNADRNATVTIVGKHCESGDVLIKDALVPADISIGDVLAIPVTGAYGYSMSSNYNNVPKPAVVFVANGNARLVLRRQELDDLLRLDVD
ncbi:MAG: diaminopimelate decarboxylase [Actinomycetota bacterium]